MFLNKDLAGNTGISTILWSILCPVFFFFKSCTPYFQVSSSEDFVNRTKIWRWRGTQLLTASGLLRHFRQSRVSSRWLQRTFWGKRREVHCPLGLSHALPRGLRLGKWQEEEAQLHITTLAASGSRPWDIPLPPDPCPNPTETSN